MSKHPRMRGEHRSDRGGERGLELLLVGLQSPINIGMILRVAEAYRCGVSILDPHRVLDDRAKLEVIEDFSCGAFARRSFHRLADAAALAGWRAGRRLVVTSIEADAVALPAFAFRPGDIVALGNEYDGVSAELVAGADAGLRIPMPDVWMPKPPARHPIDPLRTAPVARDGTPNLNVAMAAGIVCYTAYLRLAAP